MRPSYPQIAEVEMATPITLNALAARTLVPLALCALSLGAAPASAAQADAALYQRPALHSELAARSLMLDVTRAGEQLLAVGERGFILRSQDNGHSWQQVPSPVSVTPHPGDVRHADPGLGRGACRSDIAQQ